MMRIASIEKVEEALKEQKRIIKSQSDQFIEGFEAACETVKDIHKALGEELEQEWLDKKNEEAKQFVSDPEKVKPLDPRLLNDEELYGD